MKTNIKGSALLVTLVAVTMGALVIGSLLKYVSMDSSSIEKETGHIKSSETLKLASNLYNTTISNASNLTETQINELTKIIGGGAADPTIFGSTTSGTDSAIPGFEQYSISWNQTSTTTDNTMSPPDNPNGFWYFPGLFTAAITSVHSGDTVPALRNGTRATLSSSNILRTVPVFSMLSFYDRDWEISAHYESAQIIGHIHSNGNIFLDCRDSGPDRIRFHGLQDYPILSANKTVFRRGRNGETSYYKFGNTANSGLDFYIYSDLQFTNIINPNDFNYTDNIVNNIFYRDLRPDYTSWEEGAVSTDTGQEPLRRRFAGGDAGTDYGYVFTGSNSTNNFDAPSTTAGTTPAVQFGTDVDELTPPVAINPYQYIEDIQYYDTPDTIDQAPPKSSNYNEDAGNNNKLAALAFNSVAPLVIRDGVAYFRTAPGGDLTPVTSILPAEGDKTLYPDHTHTDAARYGDLRWYGWFGMNNGVLPSPSNPARWHFPLRSVTFNKTQDAANAGNAATSSEGTAIPFTFRSAAIHNPKTEGTINSAGVPLSPSWIRSDIDSSEIPGYCALNSNNPTNTNTGEGIGMFNVSYPTIGVGGVEKYDPVRVAYNAVKKKVRTMFNSSHIYTSRHNGSRMLNKDGS
ncbi:MAG: hypothetical protein ACD_79C00061G0002, partial [uncultured bacterium]